MRNSSFRHDGHRLGYSDYRIGTRPVILLPGLLISRRMHDPIARSLTELGLRVITLDFLGHGTSDRPDAPSLYSTPMLGAQVVALMDHLGIERAVIGGTSLGANVSLEVAVAAPERVRGLVLEMPVLDNALLAATVAFWPFAAGLRFGGPLARLATGAARNLPRRGLPPYLQIALDTLSGDPGASAAALSGIFFGRIAPPQEDRVKIKTRALVIGHHRDPIHPFADADMLLEELPRARLVEASHILEMRMSPERIGAELSGFVNECYRR